MANSNESTKQEKHCYVCGSKRQRETKKPWSVSFPVFCTVVPLKITVYNKLSKTQLCRPQGASIEQIVTHTLIRFHKADSIDLSP